VLLPFNFGARLRAVLLDPPYLLENSEEIGWGTRLVAWHKFRCLGPDLRALLRKASHELCSRGSIRLRATRFAQDDDAFLLVLWLKLSR
jgi:hypothetical protein